MGGTVQGKGGTKNNLIGQGTTNSNNFSGQPQLKAGYVVVAFYCLEEE